MSNYTTQLRYIIESDINIFPSECPFAQMTSSEYEHFKKHFIKHYYTYEIGLETIGLFINRLEAKLLDLSEKYDALLEVKHQDLNFFGVDYTKTSHGTSATNGNNKRTGKIVNTDSLHSVSTESANTNTSNGGHTLSLSSDTPESSVDISSNDYVSSINKNIDNTNSHTANNATADNQSHGDSVQEFDNLLDTISNTGINDASVRVFGNVDGKNIDRLLKYKNAVLTIENDIIKDCRHLFMLIY